MAMEISSNYSSYTSSYTNTTDNKKKTTESSTANETTETSSITKKTAADELSYLSGKYSNYSFVAASYSKGMRYGSNSTVNVAIDPRFLEKMANNPELEKEYEEKIADMQKIDERKMRYHEARGSHIIAHGWAIDKDGGMSSWTIGERTNKRHYGQEMTDYANKIRKQKAEKAKEQRKLEEKRKADKEKEEILEEKRMEKEKQTEMENRMPAKVDESQENTVLVGSNFDMKW